MQSGVSRRAAASGVAGDLHLRFLQLSKLQGEHLSIRHGREEGKRIHPSASSLSLASHLVTFSHCQCIPRHDHIALAGLFLGCPHGIPGPTPHGKRSHPTLDMMGEHKLWGLLVSPLQQQLEEAHRVCV